MPETRITSGAYRGRVVESPPGRTMRPTTALVRKALFDILGDNVEGSAFLDLYAGTGAVAFEALSRGAERAVLVERDAALLRLARSTATRLGCAERIRTIGADVPTWLCNRPAELGAADIAFLDAPYRDDSVERALEALGDAPPRLVVCEHHRARRLPEEPGGLRRVRQAHYGTTQLTFYRRKADAADAQPVGDTG